MPNANATAVNAIRAAAAKYGIDPQAMIAVAKVESGLRPDAIGDGGHAYGLFQFNNAGGTITGDPAPRRYLDPSFNAMQAARHIAGIKGIKGAKGADAIKLIVNEFERPADKQGEIQKALSYYGKLGGGDVTAPTITSKPTGTPSKTLSDLGQGNTLSPTPSPSDSLLSYAMQGSDPGKSGSAENGSILNILTQPQDEVPAPTIGTAPGVRGGTAPAVQGGEAMPTGSGGLVTTLSDPKIIGTPYHGTHTLGNWESDNAVDIAMPKGTPLFATEDGTIGSQIGALGGSNPRMAGLRVHLDGKDNSFYYAHLSRLAVKAGQKVKAGDLIGYSGEANGVAHLHLATQKGNPGKYA